MGLNLKNNKSTVSDAAVAKFVAANPNMAGKKISVLSPDMVSKVSIDANHYYCISLGDNGIVAIPGAVLKNWVTDHALTSQDFEIIKLAPAAVRGGIITSVLGISLMMNPINILPFVFGNSMGQSTIIPVNFAFDKSGTLTLGAETFTSAKIPHVGGGVTAAPIAYIFEVTPFDRLGGLTTLKVDFGGSMYSITFKQGNSEKMVCSVLLPSIVNNSNVQLNIASDGGAPATAVVTGTQAFTPWNSIFDFNPFSNLTFGADIIVSGINANVLGYPVIKDETSKSALIQILATKTFNSLAANLIRNIG